MGLKRAFAWQWRGRWRGRRGWQDETGSVAGAGCWCGGTTTAAWLSLVSMQSLQISMPMTWEGREGCGGSVKLSSLRSQAILTDLFSFLLWHWGESLGQGSEHRNVLSIVFHVETARSLFARQERVWRPSNKFTLAGGWERGGQGKQWMLAGAMGRLHGILRSRQILYRIKKGSHL